MTELLQDEQKETKKEERVLLGEGSQVRVYDLGNGRVRKEPKTLEEATAAISEWYDGSSQGTAVEYAEMLDRYRDQGLKYVAELIRAHPETAWFFGNPEIDEDGSLETDMLESVGSYMLRHAAPEDKRRIIDEYIGSIKTSWKMGCYDWTFQFLGNCGINRTGAVVMLDFGEMGYDKETAHEMIEQKKWETAWDPNELDPETRAYYFKEMERVLTHEALDERWRKIADS
jgi:hypothetical protein